LREGEALFYYLLGYYLQRSLISTASVIGDLFLDSCSGKITVRRVWDHSGEGEGRANRMIDDSGNCKTVAASFSYPPGWTTATLCCTVRRTTLCTICSRTERQCTALVQNVEITSHQCFASCTDYRPGNESTSRSRA